MRLGPLTPGTCLAVSLLGALGCESAPTQDSLRLTFTTESDPGVSLDGVPIWIDGELAGVSSGGEVETIVRSTGERFLGIRHDCPEGHRGPVDETILRLRTFQAVGATTGRGMEVTLRCVPREHIAGFVVRVGEGLSLPVVLNGSEVARTSSAGVAHFTRRGEPGTEYRVRVDTSSESRLTPQNPTRTFTLEDQHQVFVLDQALELSIGPRPARRPKARITKIE